VLSLLVDQNIAVNVGMAWDVGMGRAATYADYPLRQLYESGVTVTIGADMPELFNTTLNDQYLMAVEHCGLSLEALEDIALNAVRVSLLPDKEKQDLLEKFTETYARLRAEHIAPQMT
jgi:adenosine deaminase